MTIDDGSLLTLDMQNIWHPCSQMKDYEHFKPLIITGAQGSYLKLNNGNKIIDAIASWWCKSLGHQHPRLQQALIKQAQRFEHVIFANTTYDTIVHLSQKLTSLLPPLTKVFYASEGSSAVEIAMKMSLHARQIQGYNRRTKFITLQNAYHGETIAALSVSDLGLYCDPYKPLMFDVKVIDSLPYVTGRNDPLWHDCADHWPAIETQLIPFKDSATALILEPLIQGAGGMKIYSQDFLRRIRLWTKQHNIHLIADEIMTGIGRTGKMFACQHADIVPDFACISKGLTSGWLPLSAVLTTDKIYELFYDDYAQGKSFLHSHTFSGNALAASIALEVLKIFEEENICEQATQLGDHLLAGMLEVANSTQQLTNVRQLGAMVAADLINLQQHPRLGYAVFRKAVELGALLRPLGNTIYWLPPLNMDLATVAKLQEITTQAIKLATVSRN